MYIIVSGGTKGLGRAIIEKFAHEGWHIAFCARTAADVSELVSSLQERYPAQQFIGEAVDMSDKAAVVAFANHIHSQWKKIDVLVNNAGVFLPGQVIDEPSGTLELLITTNLYSAYHLTRALLPAMLPQQSGHIFNMCSVASQIAYPNGGSYSISKFALLGFSKALREELKSAGIKVTALLPGATWSDSWAGVTLPEDRLMQAQDIADTVWAAYQLGKSAVVEEIILRPQLGDL